MVFWKRQQQITNNIYISFYTSFTECWDWDWWLPTVNNESWNHWNPLIYFRVFSLQSSLLTNCSLLVITFLLFVLMCLLLMFLVVVVVAAAVGSYCSYCSCCCWLLFLLLMLFCFCFSSCWCWYMLMKLMMMIPFQETTVDDYTNRFLENGYHQDVAGSSAALNS